MKRLALLLVALAAAVPLCLGQAFTIFVSPTSAVAGSGAFTLMVSGQGLFSYSLVYWNTNLLTCTWNPTQVGPGFFDCSIPASYIASPGTAVIHAETTPTSGPTQYSNNVTFTILAPLMITTTSPLTAGTVGAGYSMTLVATGGQPPYLWLLTGGELPPGLELDVELGVISGTPTQVGTFNFTVQVSDYLEVPMIGALRARAGAGGTLAPLSAQRTRDRGRRLARTIPDRPEAIVTGTFSLTINPRPAITTTSPLPASTVGAAYSRALVATGGTSPLSWSVSAGAPPPGLTLNASSGVLSGTPTQAGTFNFTAQVSDWYQVTDSRAFVLTINLRPTITTTSPLPASTVGAVYSTTLAATGGTLPLSWSVIAGTPPPGLTLNASTGVLSGTPTQAGTFNFTAQVRDSANVSDSRAFALTINARPTITTTSPLPAFTVGAAYSTTLTATGGLLPLSWSVIAGTPPPGLTLNASSGVLGGTPTTPGTFNFTAQVSDYAQATDSRAFALTINARPTITTTSPLPAFTVGAAYSTTLTATGGTLPLTWSVSAGTPPPGLTLNASTGVLSGTPTQTGTFNFTAQVSDQSQTTDSRAFALTINARPTITTTSPLPAFTAGAAYSTTLTATGGTLPLSWSVSAGTPPPGLTLNPSSGVLGGTPTQAGTFNFTAQVSDQSQTTDSRAFAVTVNPPLAITTTSPLPATTVGIAYSRTLAATGGTPPLSWSVSAGTPPPGLTLNASSGLLSGTPTQAGAFNFTVQAADGANATATRAFALTINPPLVITTTSPLPGSQVAAAYSVFLGASGGTPPLSWSVSAGSLPPGLSLTPSTGAISGTPTELGTFSFTAQVRDSVGATDSRAFVLGIRPPPLMITTDSPLPAGTVGTGYWVMLGATGGLPRYSWSVSAGSLPPGLALDSSSGEISGTPTMAGTFNFTVTVEDGMPSRTSRGFTVTILPAPLEIITPSPLAGGTVGTPYSVTLAATGGTLPYGWSVSAGSLPSGLVLNSSSGAISGTPTTAGTFNFTAQVTDRARATASRGFTVTINPPPLEITTPSPLAAGTVGRTYSLTLAATGGTPPYAWSLSAGSLPSGLALNSTSGAITGTPTTAGTFNFTAQVTDSARATASRGFSLMVNPPELEITTASPLATGTVGKGYSATLAASGGTLPYAWSVSGGLPPPGLSLNASTGVISGTPTRAGTFSFTAQVSDGAKATATKGFAVTIDPAVLTITTASLPSGAFGSAYSAGLAADGGVPPYSWGVAAGSLPAGLSLDPASGAISGTLSAGGTFNFTAVVTDSRGATATRGFTVFIAPPPAPPLNFPGLGDPGSGDAAITIVGPGQQPRFQLSLGAAYPLPITGQVTLTFTPDAVVPRDDPAVQFATGGRTASFAIPANSAEPTPEFAIQTGTVAGTIVVAVTLEQAGTNITPAPAPSRTLRIDRLAPTVATGGVRVVRTATGFEVQIIGFSTPRQVTQATFRFASASGAELQGAEITIPLESVFTAWYQDAASTPFGSQFRYVQPFTVQGDANAVTSVTLTLANAQGSSQPVTVSF